MIDACTIARPGALVRQIVFVDGLSGSGKTAVAPVLQGLERVEAVSAKYVLDYICCLHLLGKIADDAAGALIKLLTDQALYDNLISREVNFRPSDLTCVANSPLGPEYIRRLSLADGQPVLQRMETERPILHLMGHQMFAGSPIFFRTLGPALTYVEVVRHPLPMLRQWLSYVERYGSDPSDFTIWIGAGDAALPWFARGNEAQYLRSSSMDKAIFSMRWMKQLRGRANAALSAAERARYIVIPFERFVRDPEPFIHRLEEALGTPRLPVMADILKSQKIPRAVSSAGPRGIWSEKYGVRIANDGDSESEEMRDHWQFAKQSSSPDGIGELARLCQEYERDILALGS